VSEAVWHVKQQNALFRYICNILFYHYRASRILLTCSDKNY